MTFSKFEIYFQVISNCHLKMGINFFGTPCILKYKEQWILISHSQKCPWSIFVLTVQMFGNKITPTSIFRHTWHGQINHSQHKTTDVSKMITEYLKIHEKLMIIYQSSTTPWFLKYRRKALLICDNPHFVLPYLKITQ